MQLPSCAHTKFIFITGGVVSSLGKGIAAASLGTLLQGHGYKVRLRKLDPYLNVDPGTLSPYEHGEVYVTDDGAETDLDLGHYERFTGVVATRNDNITSGKIYQDLIYKERQGTYYNGSTVQVVPHVTNEIKSFIIGNLDAEDFIICEIGGTVGDIESLPFLEAIRQLSNDIGKNRCLFIHVTLVPFIRAANEIKTKPSQHSVKEILSVGIQPDLLLCRTEIEIPPAQKRKLALFCNIRESGVISAHDLDTIYAAPEALHLEGFDTEVLKQFSMPENPSKSKKNLKSWQEIAHAIRSPEGVVTIACVGKYIELTDAYKSLIAALQHGAIACDVRVELQWIDSSMLEDIDEDALSFHFENAHAILVPGGFGDRGAFGKIRAVKFARTQKIPYLGICFGMQMAVIEFARNVVGIKNANSMEFSINNNDLVPIINYMDEWQKGNRTEKRTKETALGGTMRLGAYPCIIKQGSLASEIYQKQEISERHRHRYELDIAYQPQLEANGMIISGLSPNGKLPEIIELRDHPWFVAVQFHPELKSRPANPHPLFSSFIMAAVKQSRLV